MSTVTLQGLTAGSITDLQTIDPFGIPTASYLNGVTVTDSNTTNDTLSATISFTAGNGGLSGTGLSAGVTSNGIVSYTLSATTPAILQTELQGLVFTPASGLSATTTFTLSVTPIAILSGSDAIHNPFSVAVDSSGDLFVANYGGISTNNDGSLAAFSSSTGLMTWSLNATADPVSGAVRSPFSVAVDGSGNVWVANSGKSNVLEFSSGGTLEQTLSTGGNPAGIAIDTTGTVYVANYGGHVVQAYSSTTGTLQWSYSDSNGPQGIAINSSGDVFVANNPNGSSGGSVQELSSSSGVVAWTLTSGTGYSIDVPRSVTVDSAGNVWVPSSGNNTVYEFSADGQLLQALTSGVNAPYSVAIDSEGNVWVANDGNSGAGKNTIEAFSSSGVLIQTLSSGVSYPGGIAVDSAGNVFVPNEANNTVEEFSPVVSNSTTQISVLAVPTLSAVDYNAAIGQLTLSGNNLTTRAGDYHATDFTLQGDGGASYTLTGGSAVSGTPNATSVIIQLSAADQLAVDGLLNNNGGSANSGTAYNLSAISGWDTNAASITTLSGLGIIVSHVAAPTITGVSYNAATGVFTITGANLDNAGSSNGIALSSFTLTGGSNGSYAFSSNDSIGNLSSSSFTLALSSGDQALVNAFVNGNGTSPSSGAAYNLAVSANWDSDSGAAVTSQAVNVSGIAVPSIPAPAPSTPISPPVTAVVALPQSTLQDPANAAYNSANVQVIAIASTPSLSSFASTASALSGNAAGSKVVLPLVNNVTVAPSDLSNSAYVSALQSSGDTNLTVPLSGGSGVQNVLPGFTQVYSGGAVGNIYVVGNQSNLGVAGTLVGSTATTVSSGTQNLAVQSLTAASVSYASGPSSSFQQLYTVQVEDFSSDYTISSYYGTATLTSKSTRQTITVNIPQPAAGANNRGIDIQFLDGSISITGYTDPVSGLWTAWVTQGVASGGNLGNWYNSNAIWLVPAANSAQALDLGSASVQNNLLNTADNSQNVGFYGGTSIGLLPSTATTINNSTPNALLTGILGGGSNQTATFISGDRIALTGGNTTLNLFDFAGGTPLPANMLVSGVNTLNLASYAGIGTAAQADDFSSWSGLSTINATASVAAGSAIGNGLINLIAGSNTAVNLIVNDNYATTSGIGSQAGAIALSGGSQIIITQNLSTADGSPVAGGGISINGGSATSSVTVTQSAAVSGKVTDGAVTINDISANSTSMAGSLTTLVLNNYGNGSVTNDNALRFLTLSGAGGTLTLNDSNTSGSSSAFTVPVNTLYLTLNGLSAASDNTINDLNSEITTLNIITAGTVNSTLNGFVDSHLTSISVQGTTALTLVNPSASLTSYTVIGSAASVTVGPHSDAATANLTLSGAVTYTGTADAVSTGITLAASGDNSNISFTTTGALGNGNSNNFVLGNGNNTISDIVIGNTVSTTHISVGTGQNMIITGGNSVNITVGSHSAGITDSFSVGANSNGGLSIPTTITGAQAGDKINIADASQFNSTGITTAIVSASGGDVTTLTGWVNAALSTQGANLQSHGVSWFNFGGNTWLIEQANAQGSAFAAGDTLVKLTGTLNESAAGFSAHTVTLSS